MNVELEEADSDTTGVLEVNLEQQTTEKANDEAEPTKTSQPTMDVHIDNKWNENLMRSSTVMEGNHNDEI